jgi:hypothetical protein
MIRRGFWLVVGAAGGILGYRRVSSLGRQVAQTVGARPEGRAAVKRHWARETIRFTRDVREGMDLYFDRQQARSAPTLSAGARAQSSRPQSSTDHDKHDKREDH